MAGTHTKLKGVSHIGETLLATHIEANLVSFFDYAMLEVGGFYNVKIPSSGAYGGNFHQLRPVKDSNYTNGQVWEGFRSNWVWETGLDYSTQPIRVSGVFVNNTFQPATGVGTYAHKINYPLGRVIFDSAIPTNSTVTCNFSHKWAMFTTADSPWFREVLYRSFRVDDPHFLQFGSGSWGQVGQTRLTFPLVAIEHSAVNDAVGIGLGEAGKRERREVIFHVFAENSWERNALVDIITHQKERNIFFYNLNDIPDHRFPLDINGSPKPSGYMYPQLVERSGDGGYRWRKCFFKELYSRKIDMYHVGLFGAQVIADLEIEMYNI